MRIAQRIITKLLNDQHVQLRLSSDDRHQFHLSLLNSIFQLLHVPELSQSDSHLGFQLLPQVSHVLQSTCTNQL